VSTQSGKVYLVGAGPGAPDLITLKGAELLRIAEVVVYDYLVSAELLSVAAESAELVFVGKKGGSEERLDQNEINRMLIDRARAGMTVVRLKGGDPFIFGRGGEEAAALAEAGIDFEIVPGVTSAIAVPAFAGIPLTHRERGSFVAFVTAHEDEAKAAGTIPWTELAAAARNRGTLVILMAAARMRPTLARLVSEGLAASTPAAAIQWGTTAAQKTVLATLGTLADESEPARLGAPLVVVVGDTAAMREHLAWAEKLPLFGRRIVVTRERKRSSGFARELRRLGAEVIAFPTIETVPPDSYEALDRAIGRLGSFDWIIFTSANGVDNFIARMVALGRDIREIGSASLAAIGPATSARLKHYGLKPAIVPAKYRAEAIADAIGDAKIRGASFLLARAQVAREALPEILRGKGAREVEVVAAYKTIKPKNAPVERVRELLSSGAIDLVTFTSSSTVNNFCELVGTMPRGVKAAAIGPITAETARARGFDVVLMPSEYTITALTHAIRDYFKTAGRAS
jgi:uroporphyrinogen III methyltransferase / synthase